MSQFNLNRKWIFETYEDEALEVLHPGDAVRPDRTKAVGPTNPAAAVVVDQVARLDQSRRDHYEEWS